MSEETLPRATPESPGTPLGTPPGTPLGTPNAPRKPALKRAALLLKDIFGKPRFDDRVDTQPDLKTVETLVMIGRGVKLLAQVKWLFSIKFLLQLLMIVPGLVLPWMAKIVVDNVMLQEPFGQTEVLYPHFMDPLLELVQGQDPFGIMLTITTIYLIMLLTVGSRTGTTDAGLLPGQDAATQAENQVSFGSSAGGGLLGLAEFMAHVRLTQTVANRLRSRLFDRLTHLPMTVLDDQRTGTAFFACSTTRRRRRTWRIA